MGGDDNEREGMQSSRWETTAQSGEVVEEELSRAPYLRGQRTVSCQANQSGDTLLQQ